MNNSTMLEDLETIINSNTIDWNSIDGSTFLITGATGLIGSLLVKALIERNKKYNSNINFILLVRDLEKAKTIIPDVPEIKYIVSPLEELDLDSLKKQNFDYIIHAASPTKSSYFVEHPVETIDTALIGTKKMLELTKNDKNKVMIYLSSMEMYGQFEKQMVAENDQGFIDPLSPRSSYSGGKRACELYCAAYAYEYGSKVRIARLAQVFGAGVSSSETRVYKMFSDAAINKNDINLSSDGSTVSNYCYTTDAILGLLTILTKGKDASAYNVCSDPTGMTILDIANWISEEYSAGKMVVSTSKEPSQKYAPSTKMVLDNSKLKSLGWKPQYSLKDGYRRLIKYFSE